jgi:hypothetical protein
MHALSIKGLALLPFSRRMPRLPADRLSSWVLFSDKKYSGSPDRRPPLERPGFEAPRMPFGDTGIFMRPWLHGFPVLDAPAPLGSIHGSTGKGPADLPPFFGPLEELESNEEILSVRG